MKRLAVTAAVLFALVAAGLSIGLTAQTAARTSPIFQVDPLWPKQLPNEWILGMISGLVVDAKDHVWVLHRPSTITDFEASADGDRPAARCCRRSPPVIEFDQAGSVVQAWGGPGEGYEWPLPDQEKPRAEYLSRGPFGEHTIAVDNRDNVWLGSNGPSGTVIMKFSRAGRFVMQIG